MIKRLAAYAMFAILSVACGGANTAALEERIAELEQQVEDDGPATTNSPTTSAQPSTTTTTESPQPVEPTDCPTQPERLAIYDALIAEEITREEAIAATCDYVLFDRELTFREATQTGGDPCLAATDIGEVEDDVRGICTGEPQEPDAIDVEETDCPGLQSEKDPIILLYLAEEIDADEAIERLCLDVGNSTRAQRLDSVHNSARNTARNFPDEIPDTATAALALDPNPGPCASDQVVEDEISAFERGEIDIVDFAVNLCLSLESATALLEQSEPTEDIPTPFTLDRCGDPTRGAEGTITNIFDTTMSVAVNVVVIDNNGVRVADGLDFIPDLAAGQTANWEAIIPGEWSGNCEATVDWRG